MEFAETDPSPVRKWLTAARPWALPASTMPVIFGTSLAVVIDGARLNVLLFGGAFLAMVVLHSAANMLSDVFDFKHGLDTRVTPVSGAIVRGWLSERQVARAAVFLFAVGIVLGLVLAWRTSCILLAVGGVGVLIGAVYTLLKAHSLGDAAVFLDFGILGALGAWIVQTGRGSWLPVVWTIPMAMLVSGILHANNWRDIATDSERRVRTFAGLLGDRGSLRYYAFLLFGSQFLVVLFAVLPLIHFGLPRLPWTCLVTLAALPEALTLWGRARKRHRPARPMDFVILDGATAKYNLHFGLLYTAGLWIAYVLG
ncbi:MAG: prenyltransferase [Candidatus Aminicenantes bacterium]|nr:prenyltransferase [Candidatus Aminicenantes bacterium]